MTRLATGFGAFARNGTVRAGVVLAVFLAVWGANQLGGLNIFIVNSWLTLSLPLVLAATGVTLVIFTGQFDLSAAGVIALANVLTVTLLSELDARLAVLIATAVGVVIGLINGALVVWGRLSAIAVTLAMYIMLSGFALIVLPTPGGRMPDGLVDLFTGPFIVPRSLILLVVIIVAWLVFRRTRLGIHLFAVGQDPEAVRLSGISVARVQMTAFATAGGFYALAGVVLAAAIQSGDASSGASYLLQTFAAIAIGGTAFTGGRGSVIGTVLGALTLTAIPKFLFVIGISNWVGEIFTGALIVIAVLVGALSARSGKRRLLSRTGAPGGTQARGNESHTQPAHAGRQMEA